MKEATVHIIVHHLSAGVEASVAQLAHSSAEQRAGRCTATAAADVARHCRAQLRRTERRAEAALCRCVVVSVNSTASSARGHRA